MVLKVFLYILTTLTFVNSQRSNLAIDTIYLESVLDAEECDRQVTVIRNNVLLGMQFADAGIRTPRGILTGGFIDLGNYHQCLAIKHSTDGMDIQGKYCAIGIPVDQNISLPSFENPANLWTFNPSSSDFDTSSLTQIEKFNLIRAEIFALAGDTDYLEEYFDRTDADNPLSGIEFTFGLCIPKPCTIQQAITSLPFNETELGFRYTENYCRLPDDKPWAGADIAAVIIFSLLGLITLLSTSYDLYHRFALNTDSKSINPVYQSFSVYTNSKRLTTFTSGTGNLQCIDGIRTLAMTWIVVGHTFSTELFLANPLDAFEWTISAEGLWITNAPMGVDTFFLLGGVLLVYTTAGKMTGKTLLKNLPWFYLARLVRITPLLAVLVLLQASFFNHLADGPFWQWVANETNECRSLWWVTLLNIQNYAYTGRMCAGHSWYIAIDVQLYILSPLVLFWVLTGKKRNAWLALIGGLGVVLVASTIYNFMLNLQAGAIVPSRGPDNGEYMTKYYINTLTRAATFFVGLIFGYVLHICRGKKVQMPAILAILLWIWSFGILGSIFYFNYRIMQLDWDNQFMDNFMNSFMRPAWGCVIGWIIFACTHGYGGPINWFLSLDIWRLPARLSYGIYLFHYPFMISLNGTMVAPIFFSVGSITFKFLSYLALSVVVSYIFTILVDSPISTLYKQLMIKVQPKKPVQRESKPDMTVKTAEAADITDEIQQRNVDGVMIK